MQDTIGVDGGRFTATETRPPATRSERKPQYSNRSRPRTETYRECALRLALIPWTPTEP